MPRYFFHLYDEVETLDPDGLNLPDMEIARLVAGHELRQLGAHELRHRGQPEMSDRIDIADVTGRVLDTVCYADVVFPGGSITLSRNPVLP